MFILKEAFRSLARAKYSFFFSLISVSIGVVLIHLSLLSISISDQLQQRIKSRFSITAFLEDGIEHERLQQNIEQMDAVASVKFISKEQAHKDFIDQTGEDFSEVLDVNPLPASFVLYLNEEYWSQEALQTLKGQIESLAGIEDVRFRADIFERLLQLLEEGSKYVWGLTALLVILAFYIVYATLKLIIHNRRKEIRTMKLVGASLATIKMPVWINGVLIGILANLISFGLLFTLWWFGRDLLHLSAGDVYLQNNLIYISMITGPAIGLLCSMFAARQISIRI